MRYKRNPPLPLRETGTRHLLKAARDYAGRHKGLVGETHNPYWDELHRRAVERSTRRYLKRTERV